MKLNSRRYHSKNETFTMLQCLDIKREKEVRIAYSDGSSHYIEIEYINEAFTLFDYMQKNQAFIVDFIRFASGTEFITDNYEFFMNCVRYCNTLDAKYLI